MTVFDMGKNTWREDKGVLIPFPLPQKDKAHEYKQQLLGCIPDPQQFQQEYQQTPYPQNAVGSTITTRQRQRLDERDRRDVLYKLQSGELSVRSKMELLGFDYDKEARKLRREEKRAKRDKEAAKVAAPLINKVVTERKRRGASGWFMRSDVVRMFGWSDRDAGRMLQVAKKAGLVTVTGQWWYRVRMGVDFAGSTGSVSRLFQSGRSTGKSEARNVFGSNDSIRGMKVTRLSP